MALWYTKSVDSLLLSNESTKTTETHVQIFVFVFFFLIICNTLWKYRLIVKRWLGMLTDPAIYTTASGLQ